MPNSELFNLACALIAAKAVEGKVRTERIEIEEKIAELVPGPDSGSKTITLDDGTKITVKRGWNYRAELDKIEQAMCTPLTPAPIKTKTTRELDATGYEWYREHDPNLFSIISQYVVVSPKKVAIEVRRK